jgi:TM2 domain-containing membrane protein YozV
VQQPAPPPPQWGAQPGYPPAPMPMVNDPRKSKVAAGILGICLGSFGVHNFYLGYTGKAVAQLLITILSCGILAIVSGIWGLVEGIMILTGSINTDAAGVPLKD